MEQSIRQLLEAGLPVFTELNLVSDGYAENMVVPSNMNDAEFYELRMQYVDGLIGMDEMISKMDQRLTMMRMEGY